MIEGEIKCICQRLQINDLGLVMKRGDVVYLPANRVMSSQDLQRVKAGVRVRFVMRCQTERPPEKVTPISPPPNVPHPQLVSVPQPVAPQIDLDALAEKVSSRLSKLEGDTLQRLLQMLQPLLVESKDNGNGNTRSVSASGAVPRQVSSVTDPQFIPQMGDLPVGEVSVQEQKGEGGNVDSAVAALKKSRKTL